MLTGRRNARKESTEEKATAKKQKKYGKVACRQTCGKPDAGKRKAAAAATPAAVAAATDFDLGDSQWYLNRELTWLEFNQRVLHEAEDPRTPLLERLKFIAIVSANLDEFFMKRIGGLKQQIGAGLRERTLDGRTPRQQVVECHAVIRELEARKELTYRIIHGLLEEKNILIKSYSDLSAQGAEEPA